MYIMNLWKKEYLQVNYDVRYLIVHFQERTGLLSEEWEQKRTDDRISNSDDSLKVKKPWKGYVNVCECEWECMTKWNN